MSVLKIKNADGIFEDVLVLRGERGVGVKSIVQEGDHFLFTMTDGSVQTVVSPDCAEIVRSAAGASDSAAGASASEKNAAASQKAAAASAVNAKGSADSAAASAENAKKSEDEAKAAAEGAAQSVLEKLNYNDETGTVELTDYAKKEYVDAGDTALKEYLDEPEKILVVYYNREEYFIINSDTWGSYSPDVLFAGRDLIAGDGEISITPISDFAFSGRIDVDTFGNGEEINFSITLNGKVVQEAQITAPGNAAFDMDVKSGDTIVFKVMGCTGDTMEYMTINVLKTYELYTAGDIIAEAIRNKVFTLTGNGYSATLKAPEGYEDFFQSHEVYQGLILPTMMSITGSYLYNAEFEIPGGKHYNFFNLPDEDTALKNPTFGLLICTNHISGEWDYDTWQFVELYPNILQFIGGTSFKNKVESVLSTLLGYEEAPNAGIDTEGNSFEVTYGWEYAEKGKSFIFTPTTVGHTGANAAHIILYHSVLGSNTKSFFIKEYDSSGNLVDPTLVAGKPVLLVNNGTYLIVVR